MTRKSPAVWVVEARWVKKPPEEWLPLIGRRVCETRSEAVRLARWLSDEHKPACEYRARRYVPASPPKRKRRAVRK